MSFFFLFYGEFKVMGLSVIWILYIFLKATCRRPPKQPYKFLSSNWFFMLGDGRGSAWAGLLEMILTGINAEGSLHCEAMQPAPRKLRLYKYKIYKHLTQAWWVGMWQMGSAIDK